MRAAKAYITSLGTTGLLLCCSLLLLSVVGALVSFDAWPTTDTSVPETVAIGPAGPIAETRPAGSAGAVGGVRADSAKRARRDRRAARTRRHAAAAGSGSGDRVISGLPAPESRPTAVRSPDAGSAEPSGGAPAPTPQSGPGTGGDATRAVGNVVSGVSPQAGEVVAGTGEAVGDSVGGVVTGGVAAGP
jgi:hypothetical protein